MADLSLLERARELAADLSALRRDLHRHPELSFRETRTGARVRAELQELGLTVQEGVGGTGLLTEIGSGGPVVALRADMDALPIHESATHDYASTVDGVMHACGHDAHTSTLVGVARLLVSERDAGRLPTGTVRLLFQPSEETVDAEGLSGAPRMIQDGALEGVSAIAALHVGGHMPAGSIFIGPGPVMAAAQEVRITVRGRSAHAALPHEGVDALLLAAQALTNVQSVISRELAPTETGVISFGTIHGGRAGNVIADEVELTGTIRYFDASVGERIREGIREVFCAAEGRGAVVEIDFTPPFRPVHNDPAATEIVRERLSAALGPERIHPQPALLTAEDFGAFSEQVPGVFFWLGASPEDGPRQHHHPEFDIDESVLPVGAAALAEAAQALLLAFRSSRTD